MRENFVVANRARFFVCMRGKRFFTKRLTIRTDFSAGALKSLLQNETSRKKSDAKRKIKMNETTRQTGSSHLRYDALSTTKSVDLDSASSRSSVSRINISSAERLSTISAEESFISCVERRLL